MPAAQLFFYRWTLFISSQALSSFTSHLSCCDAFVTFNIVVINMYLQIFLGTHAVFLDNAFCCWWCGISEFEGLETSRWVGSAQPYSPEFAHMTQLAAAAAGHPATLCIHMAVPGKGMWQEALFFVFIGSGPLWSCRSLDRSPGKSGCEF